MLSTVLTALAILVGLPGATLSTLLLFERQKRKRNNPKKLRIVESTAEDDTLIKSD